MITFSSRINEEKELLFYVGINNDDTNPIKYRESSSHIFDSEIEANIRRVSSTGYCVVYLSLKAQKESVLLHTKIIGDVVACHFLIQGDMTNVFLDKKNETYRCEHQKLNYCASQKETLVLNPDEEHRSIYIIFSSGYYEKQVRAWSNSYTSKSYQEAVVKGLYISVSKDNDPDDVKGVIKAIASCEPNCKMSSVCTTGRIIKFLSRQFNDLKLQPNSHESITFWQKMRLTQIKATIDNNLQTPPSVAQLAGIMGCSESQLRKKFKAFAGQTLNEYITRQRMERAHQMILNGEDLLYVALNIGYEYQANFSTAFKRHFGYLPKEAKKVES
jgi:AraC-like DNA-binding protein